MKHLIFFICFCIASLVGNAQLEVNPGKISFGEFVEGSDRVVDILVKNNSNKTELLLRSKFSHEFEVIFSDKKIEPGGQMVVRLQFNPRAKGKFSDVCELYFASMNVPILIPISADVKYVNVRHTRSPILQKTLVYLVIQIVVVIQ